MPASRGIVVQQSFPEPRPTTNPYIVMLLQALRGTPGLRVRTFSWRGALLGRYDVFHAHWPEILVTGRGRARTAARELLFVLLMLRLRLAGIPIVRTQHNLALPSGLGPLQTALLRWFDSRTALRIAINADASHDGPGPVRTILHGDYRAWFAAYPRSDAQQGRFAYFGLIRRYKNVEALAARFSQLQGPYSLEVAGAPSTEAIAETLRRTAAEDDRITLRLGFQTDADLVEVAGRAEIVVLPYRHMHNSGAVLAALSLDRPVLVPRNAANEALAAEVGEGWVLMYDGELGPEELRAAIESARAGDRSPSPDLGGRAWAPAGQAHRGAYAAVTGRH